MKPKDLWKKYQDMALPVKASLWYTVTNVLNKGLALFSTPVFTRVMSEEQYGTFTIFQSWYSILIIFTSLNIFSSGYQKGLIKYKSDTDRFTSSQLGLTTTITLGFLVAYLVAPDFWSGLFTLSPVLMAAMFAELFTMPALEFWSAQQRFNYKYKKCVAASLLMTVLSLGGGIVAVLNTPNKVEARVYTDMGAKALVAGVLMVFLFARGKLFFKKEYWKYALAFNLPLIPHYLSNYVLNQSDRLMIGRMVGKTQAAYYSVAYTISTMMMLIVTAINNSLVPYIYKSLDAKKENGVKRSTSFLVILIAGLCALTMAFAPEVIRIFAGEKYMDAIYVIPPISTSVFFIFLYSLFSNIEYFYGKTGYIAVATGASAIANLVLNFIFIRIFGYYAAGYTTLVCYICLAILHYIFYKKVLRQEKMEAPYDMRVCVLASVVILIIMVAMTITYQFPLVRYGVIVVIAVAAIVKRKSLMQAIQRLKR